MSKINIVVSKTSSTLLLFKLFDLLGLLLLAFCFYKMIPILFTDIGPFNYSFYVTLVTLCTLLSIYIMNNCHFIYLFDASLYFIILFIAWYFV